MVPPRFATEREPGRLTMGGAVYRVSRAMSKPLMPWQQFVSDVAGEVNSAGQFVYPLVIVTVPRQAGKTTLDLVQSVQRCAGRPRQKVWHTAQTGQDARKKWREHVDELMDSPLKSIVDGRPRRSNGAEGLVFVNGSILRPHPPTRDALHGEQSDLNNIDEAWAFDEGQGDDLLQAITPTQLTRPGAQTFIWSTRGDAHSTWFHSLIERGYAREPGIALFDWSIPDDVDPLDLHAVAAHHPALRSPDNPGGLVTVDSLAAALATMGGRPGEFARAYGNRATGAGERVIPREAWADATTTDELPAGRPAFGLGVAGDGTAGAVAAAVMGADGLPWVEVIEHRPGRAWLVDYGVERRRRWPGAGFAGDRRGPAAPVCDQLDLAGVELLPAAGGEYAAACQDIFDRITDPAGPRVRLRGATDAIQAALDASADVAGRRHYGDGAWVWSRSKSGGDTSSLEAATWAAWALLRNPAPKPAPRVVMR